jgi:hypothetical protein
MRARCTLWRGARLGPDGASYVHPHMSLPTILKYTIDLNVSFFYKKRF